MIIGGDTLTGFLASLGNASLTPVCEINSGAVLCHLADGDNVMQVITKSGGFGDGDVIGEIAEILGRA
jgi:uncharacterized protein YgbK (DUF1537 family)